MLRLDNGIIQNQVRTTEYAVLEDTLPRRTFDESGDYSSRDFDLDLREHLISVIIDIYFYTSAVVQDAAGGPSKTYVKGYEIETLSTTFVDVDKV